MTFPNFAPQVAMRLSQPAWMVKLLLVPIGRIGASSSVMTAMPSLGSWARTSARRPALSPVVHVSVPKRNQPGAKRPSPEAVKAYERGGSMRQTYGLRVLSVKLVLLDDKKRKVKLRVVSAYAPTSAASKEEKELYEDNLGQAISDTAEDEILIIGADTNASCGRDNVKLHAGKSGHIPDDEMVQSPVGPHGIDWRNVAGDELMTFLGLRNMCLPMTFFQKKMSRRGTWQHPRSKKDYELDQFMVKRGDLKRVVDAGT